MEEVRSWSWLVFCTQAPETVKAVEWKTANAPKIILNNDSDLIKMAENFQASVTTDPLQTELKEKYDLLEYIDLRFGNRVYYRFRQ